MRQTANTTIINGEKVAYKVSCGFNCVNVDFYFPHRTCVQRNFVLETHNIICRYKSVDDYRSYTAVRFTIDSSGFDEMSDVIKYCVSCIHEVQWFPVSRGKNFWKELDLWFSQQLYGLDEEIRMMLKKGYSLEEALHEWDLITDFTEKTL